MLQRKTYLGKAVGFRGRRALLRTSEPRPSRTVAVTSAGRGHRLKYMLRTRDVAEQWVGKRGRLRPSDDDQRARPDQRLKGRDATVVRHVRPVAVGSPGPTSHGPVRYFDAKDG